MKDIINVQDLCIFRDGVTILEDVNFLMNSDQHLAVIGPNGAGKSFLLAVLSADMIPSRGKVTILGKTFGKCSLWDIRKQVGFLSSRMMHWIDGKSSVWQVIGSAFFGAYGVKDPLSQYQEQAITRSLEFFGMLEFWTRVFQTLSDGEKRKVLLCRALVTEPGFLVLDEPCQGLDIKSRDYFLTDLDRIGKKIPLIYVTHHLEELPNCIREIIFLKGGRVFAGGSKENLLTSDYLSELFDCRIEVVKRGEKYYMLGREDN